MEIINVTPRTVEVKYKHLTFEFKFSEVELYSKERLDAEERKKEHLEAEEKSSMP